MKMLKVTRQGTVRDGISYYGNVDYLNKHGLPKYSIDIFDDDFARVHHRILYINKDGSVSVSKSRLLRKMLDHLDSNQFFGLARVFCWRCKSNEFTESDYGIFHAMLLELHDNIWLHNCYDSYPEDISIITLAGEHNYAYAYQHLFKE